jgi:hypothetical protein
MNEQFPKKSAVWRGAILGGLVNATMTAQSSDYACHQHWAGNDYGLNGADGRQGFVCFEGGPWTVEGRMVGVFFSAHSPRSPLHADRYELEAFFQGCPAFQRSVAEEVMHPAMEYFEKGNKNACITAAFWDEGDHLSAADSWDEIMDNGVDLIANELIEDVELAYRAWQEEYDMSDEQVEFVKSLFHRKMVEPKAPFELADEELGWLQSTFQDPKQQYLQMADLMAKSGEKKPDLKWLDSLDPGAEHRKALDLCGEKFAALGVLLPNAGPSPLT